MGSFTALSADQNSGGFGTKTIYEPPIKSSINLISHHAKEKNFVFHFNSLPAGSGWNDFLSGNQSLLSIGSTNNGKSSSYYLLSPLGETFDWLIYFDKVRASEQL